MLRYVGYTQNIGDKKKVYLPKFDQLFRLPVFLYAGCKNTGQCCTKGAFCGLSSRNHQNEPICRCPKDHVPSENDYQCVPLFPCKQSHCPENKVCNKRINLCVCVNGFTLKENGLCYLSGKKYIQPGPVNADDVEEAEIEEKGVTPKTGTSPSTTELASTEKPDKSRDPGKDSSPSGSHSSGVEPFSASPALSMAASNYQPNASQVQAALKNRQPKNVTHVITAKEKRKNGHFTREIVISVIVAFTLAVLTGLAILLIYIQRYRPLEDTEAASLSLREEAFPMVPLGRFPGDESECDL